MAANVDIKRLNGADAVVGTYGAPGEDSWFARNLDPNGMVLMDAALRA